MFKALKVTVLLLLAFCPMQSMAEENNHDSPKNWQIPMNTRVFDLGVDPESLWRDPGFIPIDRAPWIFELINEDPVLRGRLYGIVVHIDVLPQPVEYLWRFSGRGGVFKFSEGIPEQYHIEGYDVQSSMKEHKGSFLYIPEDQIELFSVSCSLDRRTRSYFSSCGMAVGYPPDPNIYIKVRIYSPEKIDDLGSGFKAIAQRVREIVYCLDVTDEINRETGNLSKDVNDLIKKQENPQECEVLLPS